MDKDQAANGITEDWREAVDQFIHNGLDPAKRRQKLGRRAALMLIAGGSVLMCSMLVSAWRFSSMTPEQCRSSGNVVLAEDGQMICRPTPWALRS